jgi:hypothetical protein
VSKSSWARSQSPVRHGRSQIKPGPVTKHRRPKATRLQTFIPGPVLFKPTGATCQAVTESAKAAKTVTDLMKLMLRYIWYLLQTQTIQSNAFMCETKNTSHRYQTPWFITTKSKSKQAVEGELNPLQLGFPTQLTCITSS